MISRSMVLFRTFEFKNRNIDELLDIQYNQLSSTVERWTYEGSDWPINTIIQHQLLIPETSPCEGIFYFPKELRNPKKGVIKIQ